MAPGFDFTYWGINQIQLAEQEGRQGLITKDTNYLFSSGFNQRLTLSGQIEPVGI
jgi:hypothetical protein